VAGIIAGGVLTLRLAVGRIRARRRFIRAVGRYVEPSVFRRAVNASSILLIPFGLGRWNTMTTIVVGALIVGALAAFCLRQHLSERIWLLTVNCWQILSKEVEDEAHAHRVEASRLPIKEDPRTNPAQPVFLGT
jgi:hypothetical protein